MSAGGNKTFWLTHPLQCARGWLGSSIAHRVTALTAAVTLALTVVIAFILHQQHSELIRDRIQRDFKQESSLAAREIAHRLNALADELARLAGNPMIAAGLADETGRAVYLIPFFRNYHLPAGLQATIALYDQSGVPVAGSAGHVPGSLTDAPWFRRVIEMKMAHVESRSETGARTLMLAKPVIADPLSGAAGVLAVYITLPKLLQTATAQVQDGRYNVLVDSAGNRMFANGYRSVADPLLNIEEIRISAPDIRYSMRLETRADRNLLFAPLNRLAWTYFAVSLGVFLLLAWLWSRCGGRIADELTRMSKIATEILAGAMEAKRKLHVTGNDELAQLGNSFNTMLEQVSNSQQQLDTRVAERTMMLQDMNSALIKEIISHKQTGQQLNVAANAIENAAEGVMICNAEGRIVSINKAFTNITGHEPENVVGQTPEMLISAEQTPKVLAEIRDTVMQSGHWKGQLQSRKKDGATFIEERSVSAVRDEEGNIVNFIVVFSDVTQQKDHEKRIHYLAHHDSLTGLANRVLFQQRLAESIHRANRTGGKVAMMFIDLDHFKAVNDSLGHAYGDDLLQKVAGRINECVRKTDTVARFGGDEFAVLLDEISDSGDIAFIAKKIIERLASTFKVADHEVYVSASIGISFHPDDGQQANTLIKNADAAMYAAKEQGRNNYQFFSAEMNARALETLMMSSSLRLALERDELFLEYQPRIDFQTGAITGAEALIRWTHPTIGRIMPAQFIGIAEKTGLIDQVGEWVVRKACRQIVEWQSRGVSLPRIAVNLAARQFNQTDFTETIARIIRDTGVQAHALEVEVTESMVMHDPQRTAVILERLKGMGVAVAIDDFGTGYSSLSYLKRFPIDYIKIDQSFVRGLPHDAEDSGIVRAVIALARTLNVKLIAEGVDTREQVAFLRREGCDQGQGYLISVPISAENVEKFVANYDPAKAPWNKPLPAISAPA